MSDELEDIKSELRALRRLAADVLDAAEQEGVVVAGVSPDDIARLLGDGT